MISISSGELLLIFITSGFAVIWWILLHKAISEGNGKLLIGTVVGSILLVLIGVSSVNYLSHKSERLNVVKNDTSDFKEIESLKMKIEIEKLKQQLEMYRSSH